MSLRTVLLCVFVGQFNAYDAAAAIIVSYTFEDENATTATNTGSLGAAMDGTISGGSIIASPLSPDGKGLLLGGANGNGIAMPNGFDFENEFTISMLARLDEDPSTDAVLFDDFGGPGVLLSVNSSRIIRFTLETENDGEITVLGPEFSIGTWTKIDAVYDGTRAFLRLDNSEVASASASGNVLNHPAVTPNVGVESDDTVFPWKGAVDDFSISTVAIPEPSSLVFLLIPFMLLGTGASFKRGSQNKSRCFG